MSKNKKNVQEEVMEQEAVVESTEIEVVETEEKKPGKLAKVGSLVKKHGKKIAVGAGVALATAGVFVVKTLIDAKNGEDAMDLDFSDDLDGDDTVIIDLPAEDVETIE